jgi:hypothetical protein
MMLDMQEPVPIHDLGGSEGHPREDEPARATVADRVTELLVDTIASVSDAVIGTVDDAGDEELRDLAAATAGLAIEACRALGQIASTIERGVTGPAAATTRSPIAGDLLAHWAAVWHEASEERPKPGETAQRLLDRVLEQLDLTALIRSHVDLQAIARDVDFNALVEGVDVDALADRVDMSALVRRIDVNELAARVDVDAIASRIDIEELIRRLDLAQIASEVIEELDLADLVRDAASETTSEGVRTVRLRGVDADRAVRRAVDRVLSRRDGNAS